MVADTMRFARFQEQSTLLEPQRDVQRSAVQSSDDPARNSEPSDNALIRQCVAGNANSFRWLYQRYHQKVRALLYQLCDAATLDDLVQEVFLRAWKGLPKFRQSSQFSTWLYRIAWNVASDQRQLLAKGRSRFDTLKQQSQTQQDAPDLMHLHYQDIVQRGLHHLSFEHRTILVMHDLEDIAQKEISDILGIPLGTVKSRLFHARAAMRQFLHREGVQL